MNAMVKIFVTLLVIGFILIFMAAGVQEFNRHLADILGYTGLGMWATDLTMAGLVFLYKVWWDEL